MLTRLKYSWVWEFWFRIYILSHHEEEYLRRRLISCFNSHSKWLVQIWFKLGDNILRKCKRLKMWISCPIDRFDHLKPGTARNSHAVWCRFPQTTSNGCSMCHPKDSMEDQMILRIVYLEHYRYWITLNRGRLRTDHKTKFRRRLKFTPSRNFFLMSNDQNRLNGINNTWDKPSTFQQKEDSIFLNILNLFPLISWTIYFLLGFNGKFSVWL